VFIHIKLTLFLQLLATSFIEKEISLT